MRDLGPSEESSKHKEEVVWKHAGGAHDQVPGYLGASNKQSNLALPEISTRGSYGVCIE